MDDRSEAKPSERPRSLWTRGLKFGIPTRGNGDDQAYYVQDGDDRIEVMCHDYGEYDALRCFGKFGGLVRGCV